MKKVFNVLIVCSALLSVFSCTNPDIEIRKVVTVTVDPSAVISSYTPLNRSDFDFFNINGVKTKLHIKALLYNEDGDLLNEFDGDLSSYDNKLQIPMTVDSKCKLFCFSYLSTGKDFETHTFSGIGKMSTLKIKQTFMRGCSFLGYANILFGSTDSQVTVNLESLSSMVYLYYTKIHSNDSIGIDEYKMWFQFKDIAKYNGNSFVFETSCLADEFYIDDIDPSDYTVDNVYALFTCLPGTFDTFASLSIGAEESSSTDKVKMSVKSGHQYVMELDCKTMDFYNYEGPLTTKSDSACAISIK